MKQQKATRLNTQILNESMNKKFDRMTPQRRMHSLPPLKLAQLNYTRIKNDHIRYHNESPIQDSTVCLTIREIDELCANTRRYSKQKDQKRFYTNHDYFNQIYKAMNNQKLKVHEFIHNSYAIQPQT